MWHFDPLPYQRGPPNTLKVAGRVLRRDLGHGPQEGSSIALVAAGAHPSATAQMKEVWVLKLDLEGALAKDREVEDFPLTGEDAKGMGSLPCSPGSDLVTNKHQPSIVGGRQTLNLVERGASALRCRVAT
ncbi:hypothetical protein BHM03_00048400 [Ensete ventricosum]|nr:hypothetical protein BHM03_00048400 [Ensete ventricosum]